MGLIFNSVSASDLILDGRSVSLYVGGNPPTKVWPTRETVQITLGTGTQARDQFRAALTERGLSYQTITEVPFEIELIGTGAVQNMFYGCSSLTTVPDMDTSSVTDMIAMFSNCSSLTKVPGMDTSSVRDMYNMFRSCSSLTTVPDMDTSSVTRMNGMFRNCSSLTDGNVRLIGRHPNVTTTDMITGSGLTRLPWYNADGTPLAPREVTIAAERFAASFDNSPTGDVSLIAGWVDNAGERGATFVAPVTCSRDVRNLSNFSAIYAGNTIPTGQGVAPTYGSQNPPYVFTEVL